MRWGDTAEWKEKKMEEKNSEWDAIIGINVTISNVRAPATHGADFKLYQEEHKTRKRARGQHITRINSPCLTWKAIRNTRAGAEGPRDTSTGGGDRAGGTRGGKRWQKRGRRHPSTILVYNEIGRATSDTYIRGVGFLGNYKLRFQ